MVGSGREELVQSQEAQDGAEKALSFFAPMKLLSGALLEKCSISGSTAPVMTSTALNPYTGRKAAPCLRNAGRAEERVRSRDFFFWSYITLGATAAV